MIGYELARRLKDAGFPQRTHYDSLTDEITDFVFQKGRPSNPTLSELIDECGNNLSIISNDKSDGDWCGSPDATEEHSEGQTWHARSRIFYKPERESLTSSGFTPEEAVANLWLAIKGVDKFLD